MLLGVHFRSVRPTDQWDSSIYLGPNINSLPEEVTGSIDHILRQVGLETELIVNMSITACATVEQLNY